MEISPLIAFIWIELTFVTIGALLFILIYSLGQKAKRKKAVNDFFKTIKADRQRRMDEIRQALLGYGLDENDVEKRLRNIDHHEMNLYQHIGLIYIKKSDLLLKTINVAQETTTQSFLDLGLSAGSESGGGADQSELDTLRSENENLKSELSVTMDTIGRMLSEYSSMFGSDADDGLDKDKIMESFDADEDQSPDNDEVSVEIEDESVDSEELLEINDELSGVVPDDELMEIADEAFAQVDAPELQAELETEMETEVDFEAEPEASEVPASDPASEAVLQSDIEPEMVAESESVPDTEPAPGSSQNADTEAELDLTDLDVDEILASSSMEDNDDFDPANENVTADEINAALDELELSDMIDIESDLADAVESAGQADNVDTSDVQIEDMDEFDIDALLEKHVEER